MRLAKPFVCWLPKSEKFCTPAESESPTTTNVDKAFGDEVCENAEAHRSTNEAAVAQPRKTAILVMILEVLRQRVPGRS
jgi:hypothetical protein